MLALVSSRRRCLHLFVLCGVLVASLSPLSSRPSAFAAGTTLTASPVQVVPGATVTLTWAGFSPSGNDWISLHPYANPPLPSSSYMAFKTMTKTAAGSLAFPLPTTIKAGQYEFRIFRNGAYEVTSNVISVSASTAPTVAPVPTGNAERRTMIVTSYQEAFGRDPSSEELAYWMGLPSTDNRLASLATLVANHRTWLVSHTDEQTGTIVRVYRRIFQRSPQAAEISYWEGRIARNQMIYSEIVREIVANLVKSAYQHLSVDPNTNGAPVVPSEAVIDSYTALVASGALTGRSTAPSGVWSSVARSSAIEANRGAYAPANTDYQGKREQCFGAIGPKCAGAPGTGVVWGRFFTTPDGVRMGYEHAYVSVGSILHDNTCLRLPQGTGAYCHGAPDWAFEGAGNNKDTFPAGREWNKAVYDQRDTRYFQAWFGPYPTTASAMAQFSDDLRGVPNRRAMLAHVYLIADSRYTIPYTGGETKQTHTLDGPRGAKIDPTDAAFCRSGRIQLEHNWTGQQWGVCT